MILKFILKKSILGIFSLILKPSFFLIRYGFLNLFLKELFFKLFKQKLLKIDFI